MGWPGSPMRVSVNGEPRDVPEGGTLAGLLDELGVSRQRVAVAVNAATVPRRDLDARPLAEGDAVEIIEAVGGG